MVSQLVIWMVILLLVTIFAGFIYWLLSGNKEKDDSSFRTQEIIETTAEKLLGRLHAYAVERVADLSSGTQNPLLKAMIESGLKVATEELGPDSFYFEEAKKLINQAERKLAVAEANTIQQEGNEDVVKYCCLIREQLEELKKVVAARQITITRLTSYIQPIITDAEKIAVWQSTDKQTDEKRDYYEILGVSSLANQEEIRQAYYQLAQLYHPDKYAGRPQEFQDLADKLMKKINEAYETLKDPIKRAQYNQQRGKS